MNPILRSKGLHSSKVSALTLEDTSVQLKYFSGMDSEGGVLCKILMLTEVEIFEGGLWVGVEHLT